MDSSTAVAGTLEFLGAGTVTGTIGATKAITALKFSGAGSKIDLGVVDANIIFHNSTQYNANGDINGSIDFQGNDGIINVADNVNISGSISSRVYISRSQS